MGSFLFLVLFSFLTSTWTENPNCGDFLFFAFLELIQKAFFPPDLLSEQTNHCKLITTANCSVDPELTVPFGTFWNLNVGSVQDGSFFAMRTITAVSLKKKQKNGDMKYFNMQWHFSIKKLLAKNKKNHIALTVTQSLNDLSRSKRQAWIYFPQGLFWKKNTVLS